MTSVAVVSPCEKDDTRPTPTTPHYRPLTTFQMLDEQNLIIPTINSLPLAGNRQPNDINQRNSRSALPPTKPKYKQYFQNTQNPFQLNNRSKNKPTHRRARSQPAHFIPAEEALLVIQEQQENVEQDNIKSPNVSLPRNAVKKTKSIQQQHPTISLPTKSTSPLPLAASPSPPTEVSSPQPPTDASPVSSMLSISPLSPALDALVVVAVVEHADSNSTCSIRHLSAPNSSLDDSIVTNARSAILESDSFIFPRDTPTLSSSSSTNSFSDEFPNSPISEEDVNNHDTKVSAQLDSARVLPVSSHALFDALNEPHSEPSNGAISKFIKEKRTQSRSQANSFNENDSPPPYSQRRDTVLLRRPSSTKSINETMENSTENSQAMESPSLRRAQSLPRRPSSSPVPRVCSLGLPAYTNTASFEDRCNRRQVRAATVEQHRQTKHILRCATVHVFARTAPDGSRQYVFCRPLSSVHALVVLSSIPLTAPYAAVMERTASKYSVLIDRVLRNANPSWKKSKARTTCSTSKESRFQIDDLLRCPPKVARGLCRAVVEGLRKQRSTSLSIETPPRSGKKPWMSTEYLSTSMDAEADSEPDLPANSDQEIGPQLGRKSSASTENSSGFWFSSSNASSGLSTPIKGSQQQPRVLQQNSIQSSNSCELDLKNITKKDRQRTGWTYSSLQSSKNSSSHTLPWDVAASSSEPSDQNVMRVLELADCTVLLHHLSVRSIIALIVAILEERRICIIGPTTAIVSRSIVALENLMRPFTFPHPMSPILTNAALPYLGAPFPYLFGILNADYEEARKLPLDQVVFADLKSGKVFTTDDLGDMYKRMPRRLRQKLERRLTRVKTACTRQVSQVIGTSFMGVTASVFFSSNSFDIVPEKQPRAGSILWRMKSQQKQDTDTMPTRNIWLDYDTIITLDKALRKFFAELLEDLPAARAEMENSPSQSSQMRFDSNNAKIGNTGTTVSFTSSKRDLERRQLIKTFMMTQIFMLWEAKDDHDIQFGVKQESSSLLKKRAVTNMTSIGTEGNKEPTKKTNRKKHADNYANTRNVMSDTEVFVNMKTPDVNDLTSSSKIHERKSRRFMNKRRGKRNQRTRQDANNEPVNFAHDDRVLQSDTETTSRRRLDIEEIEDFVNPYRSPSLECVADPEFDPRPKRSWLSFRLNSKSWSVGHDLHSLATMAEDDEFNRESHIDPCDGCSSDGESDYLGENVTKNHSREMLPSDDTNVGWGGRVRYWHKRRMRNSTRH